MQTRLPLFVRDAALLNVVSSVNFLVKADIKLVLLLCFFVLEYNACIHLVNFNSFLVNIHF